MPITRAMPLATAFVLGGISSRVLAELTLYQRMGLILALLLFLTMTVYNRDLWGLGGGNTILSTLLILSLGALTAEWRPQSKRRLLLAAGGLLAATGVMAMIMPKISIMLHNDMSTASRIASLNNFCLIIVALLLNLALSMPGRLADQVEGVVSDRHNEAYWIMLGTVAIAQQPLLGQHFIGLAAGHFENLIAKMGLLLASAVIVIIAGGLLRWVGKWLLERTGLMRRLNNWIATLPTSLGQCWPWQAVVAAKLEHGPIMGQLLCSGRRLFILIEQAAVGKIREYNLLIRFCLPNAALQRFYWFDRRRCRRVNRYRLGTIRPGDADDRCQPN